MKKLSGILFIFVLNISVILASGIGMISDEDFISVGVTQESIDTAKEIIKEASTKYKLKVLDKKSLEIEMNKYILDGTEKNIEKLNELVEQVGKIDSEIIKDKLKYQIEVQKNITTEQYMKARERAFERLQKIKEND